MATKVAELVAELKLQSEAFERKLDRVEKQVRGQRKSFDDLGKTVKNWAASFLTIDAGLRVLRHVGTVIMEAEQASARLDATLKATGDTAGRTANDITKLAESLEKSTLFDDKEIMNAAAALTTFKNISGDTFDRTIKAAADLSAAFGDDLGGTVEALGRALDDPIQGMAGLRRANVLLSDAQKETITKLVEQNKLAEAQGVILTTLEGKVKGTAEALGETGLTGSLNALGDAIEGFIERTALGQGAGDGVPPAIRNLADFIDGLDLSKMQRFGEWFIKFTPFFFLNRDRKETSLTMPPAIVTPGGILAPVTVTGTPDKPKGKPDETIDPDILQALDRANDSVREFARQYDAAATEAVRGAEDMLEAEDRILQKIREKFDEIAANEKELSAAESAERWAEGWGKAIDSVAMGFENAIYGTLTRQIRTWRDFLSEILTMWQRTLAQMAAMRTGNQITGFLTTLITSGVGAAFGRNGPGGSGFVDSPVPGAPSPGANVASAGATNITMNFSLASLDPRTHSDLIMQQIPTIKAAVYEAVSGDRGFARSIAAAGT